MAKIENWPNSLDVVPVVKFLIVTEAEATNFPFSSLTVPEMVLDWAKISIGNKNNAPKMVKCFTPGSKQEIRSNRISKFLV